MAEVVNRPYGVSARINKDGSVYLHCRRTLMVDGVDVKDGDPEPLAGQSDPIFVEFATLFNAAAVADRDRWKAERDDALAKLSVVQSINGSLRSENASLRAMIEKLTATTLDGQ